MKFLNSKRKCSMLYAPYSLLHLMLQVEMLRNAWRSVHPGGLVLIRDHGLCDMVQVRPAAPLSCMAISECTKILRRRG